MRYISLRSGIDAVSIAGHVEVAVMRRPRVRTMQPHVSQPWKGDGPLPASANSERKPNRAARLRLCRPRIDSSRGRVAGTMRRCGRYGSIIPCLSSPDKIRDNTSAAAGRLGWRPYIRMPISRVFPSSRHLSRIFPAHPRSLAWYFSRAPSPQHAKAARREPRFCGLRASAFSGLLPQPGALGPSPENAALALGAGHRASLRA